MSSERVRVVVSGEVQGVFFRTSTEDLAERLGLTGWVRNRSDGRVEAEFQGPSSAIEEAVEFCRSGPRHADVLDIEVEKLEPVEGERGFEVR
jgi:acylphosphatase